VGVLRDAASLAAAARVIDEALTAHAGVMVPPSRAAFEASNLATVARAMVGAAAARTESRGCHRRTDHDSPHDEWLTHLYVSLAGDGDDAPVVVSGGPAH
jgi:aspartate oxidase